MCAPYDLIVIPTLYDSEMSEERVKFLCDLIRRGSREVVSGNQKSEIYNTISNACAISGARLAIPLKAQFEITDVTARRAVFKYGEREGFTLRSPSVLLRDSAMTVIEAALALRRGGVKLPWSSISEGLADATNMECFDLLSLSPLAVIDSASDAHQAEMLIRTVSEIFGEGAIDKVSVCIPESAMAALAAFEGKNIESLIVFSQGGEADASGGENRLDSMKKCAKEAVRLMKDGKNLFVFGSVAFAFEMKNEILKLIN